MLSLGRHTYEQQQEKGRICVKFKRERERKRDSINKKKFRGASF
jgi:hypothetical protein